MEHDHAFSPDALTDVADWMRVEGLRGRELAAQEPVDSKMGNGSSLVFRVPYPQF